MEPEKQHLRLRYDWIEANRPLNSAIIGFPDNIVFNKYDGYAVLHFLARYMEMRGWKNHDQLQRLERVLREAPLLRKSHLAIKNWFDENFKEFPGKTF
jgi:hypothetical protein